MRNTILSMLIATMLCSCNKEDPALSVSHTAYYAKSGITATKSARLFARTGEVKDAARLDYFNALDSQYASDNIKGLANSSNGFLDTLFFPTETSARILSYYKADFGVTQESGSFILTGKDTTTGFTLNDEMSRSMAYLIAQVKPVIHSEEIYGVGGGTYSFKIRFFDRFPVRPSSAQELIVPLVSFTRHHPPELFKGRETIKSTLLNEFYRNIPDGDTVVIREYEVHLKQ